MNPKQNSFGLAWLLAIIIMIGMAMDAEARDLRPGRRVAQLTLYSALHDASADYWLAVAKAENLPGKEEQKEAASEAKHDLRSNIDDIEDQHEARLAVSKMLGNGRYNPETDSDDFLTPAETEANPNPFMPLISGQTHVYRAVSDEGTEIVRVHVTDLTREILGVICIEVHDKAEMNGVVIEDTRDWYAQDVEGNVWYFGEQSLQYENDKVVSIDGSWEAGEDGALPGIVMKANPVVGDVYRQEFALGEAEDIGRVLGLGESATVPFGGTYNNCLKTEDFTPMEPDHIENKFFASGVGEILTIDTDTGVREELIDSLTE